MKQYILICVTVLFFCSCDQSAETEVKDITPTAHQIDSADLNEQFNTHSENLRILFRNTQSVFRGYDFNSSKETIINNEDTAHAVLAKMEGSKLSYDIEFNVLEEADVLYYFNSKGKLIKIESDIYPKDQAAQSSLFNEIQFYLNKKWGAPSEKDDTHATWKITSPAMQIKLKKAGNDKIYDLELDFISGTDSVIN